MLSKEDKRMAKHEAVTLALDERLTPSQRAQMSHRLVTTKSGHTKLVIELKIQERQARVKGGKYPLLTTSKG